VPGGRHVAARGFERRCMVASPIMAAVYLKTECDRIG
jgi:hypothetical protein